MTTAAQPVSNYTLNYWDPAIKYSGSWTASTVQGLPNGTTITNTTGASATLSFDGVAAVVHLCTCRPADDVVEPGWHGVPDRCVGPAVARAGHGHLLCHEPHIRSAHARLGLTRITIVQIASTATSTGTAGMSGSSTSTASPSAGTAHSGAMGRKATKGTIAGGVSVISGVVLVTLLWLA